MFNRRIKQQSFLGRFLLLILLGIFTIFMTTCGNYKVANVNNNYSLITINKGVGKYSFEHNNNYKVTKVDIGNTYTSLNLDGPEVGENHDVPFISIFTRKLKDGELGYGSALEEVLNTEKSQVDFKIQEQFPMSLLGDSGDEVAYYYMWQPPMDQKVTGEKSKPLVVRLLMFTQNNRLW